VPFALVTAYAADGLDGPLLRAAPRVGKPFTAAGLVRAVARLRPEAADRAGAEGGSMRGRKPPGRPSFRVEPSRAALSHS
jgi:hypothetical protein